MPSSGRLQCYGICTLLLGVLLALYGCEGDPQAKKARYMQKGLAYMAEKKYTAAVLEFKNAVQLDPNDAQAHYQLGLAHLQMTAEPRDRGALTDLRAAFRALHRSVQLDAKNIDAQLKLGGLYLLAKDATEAQAKAEFVLKNAADNVEAHILLSQAYASQGEWDKAIATLRTALSLEPARIALALQLAELYQHHNELDAAEKTYQSVLADRKSVV